MQEQPQREAGEQRVWMVCQRNNSPDGGQEEQRAKLAGSGSDVDGFYMLHLRIIMQLHLGREMGPEDSRELGCWGRYYSIQVDH
jgi:hypothetical protein